MIVNQKLVFNYNMKNLIVFPEKSFCVLDKYRYDLLAPAIVRDQVLYMGLADLKRIYSPEKVLPDTFPGAIRENGALYVPVIAFHAEVLRKRCTISQNRYIFSDAGVNADRFQNLWWDLDEREKDWGDLYRVFWWEPLGKLLPYRLYIPTWYDGSKPAKLLCILHGGGSNTDEVFTNTHNRIQQYAEKKGYILLAIDSGDLNSTYGCLLLPEGADIPGLDYTCPDNPMHLSESCIDNRRKSEDAVLHVIDLISRTYNIDPDHRYLFGNSMGGMGAFYIPAMHHGIFRATVPAGAAPDMRFFDFKKLADIPILLIGGTEDYHGFDYIRNAYVKCASEGLNIRLLPVAGARHEDSYGEVLDEIFDFMEENG